jgi:cytochrome c biogenesis protein ResB
MLFYGEFSPCTHCTASAGKLEWLILNFIFGTLLGLVVQDMVHHSTRQWVLCKLKVTTQEGQKIKTPYKSIGYKNPIPHICLNFKQKHLLFGISEQL